MRDVDCWAMLHASYANSTFLRNITFTFSSFGMILSVIALTLLILTAVLFAEWRHNYKNQLLIQFMAARFIYSLVRYVCDVFNMFHIAESYFYPIYLGKLPMAYSEMVLVTWMCVFSKQMHDSLARVFNTGSQKILKVSLFTWFVPAIISVLFFIAYTIQSDKDVQFFIMYLFLIKWPALCANGIILVSVLKSIISNNKSKTESNPRIVFVMITLIFTFCFQQAVTDFYKLMYAIFSFDHEIVYIPIFFVLTNILTIYHCAFSIIFWLFANKRTRMLWRCGNKNQKQRRQITCNTIS